MTDIGSAKLWNCDFFRCSFKLYITSVIFFIWPCAYLTMAMKTNLLPKLYKEKPFKMQYMAFISKQTNKKKTYWRINFDNRGRSKTYTAAQKFPFKIAKQASTMNPDKISKSCTYTKWSLCQSTECFIVKQILNLRLYLCLFKGDVYFLMKFWSKWRYVVIIVYTESYYFCSLSVKCSLIQFEN